MRRQAPLLLLAVACALSSAHADERSHRVRVRKGDEEVSMALFFSTTIDPFSQPETLSTSKPKTKKKYKQGEALRLWVNKVGPYNNPQQTYYYDTLPLCRPKSDDGKKKPKRKSASLGEVLGGNRLVDSQLELAFLEPVPKERQTICSQVLDAAAVESLSRAVRNHYWFELYLDDLPVSGVFYFRLFFFLFPFSRREGKKTKKLTFFSLPFFFKTTSSGVGLHRQPSLSGL